MTRKRQNQLISVLDVAAYILNNQRNTPMLAWKMHKLVYFCQIQQLISTGVLMFYEKILATPKGIMIKELYPLHRSEWYIGDSSKGNLNHLSLRQADIVIEVVKKYGDRTMEELDELIELTSYWKKAKQVAGNPKEIEIKLEDCS